MKLNRLIFERIDHRIIAGTVSFLLIMVLVGWIWINENGRMAVFENQYLGRSIERGAVLFAANCSTCHSYDGRGILGRGPALNSPYMFGHDFLASIDNQLDALNQQKEEATAAGTDTTDIDAQIADLTAQRDGIIATMGPAVNLGYKPDEPARLTRLGWTGTLRAFVTTTLISGRPTSGQYWPQPMGAWSQTAGGPLRTDQIEDLTNFILNWDKRDNWTVDDLNSVRQFPIYPVDPATVVSTGPSEPTIGAMTTIADIMTGLEGVTGDAQAGQQLYNGAQFACIGCHGNAAVAPLLEGTYTRTNEVRLQDPLLAGYTAQMYLAESITHPNDYIVPNYPAGVMPQNFADRLTYQQLADLVAYLETQDQPAS